MTEALSNLRICIDPARMCRGPFEEGGACLCRGDDAGDDIQVKAHARGCPLGLFPRPAVIVEVRPPPSTGQVVSFTKAMLAGKYVPQEVVTERMEICRTCDLRRTDAGGDWCGACGCSVFDEARKLANLAAYEENLPYWGCKHPQRAQGKGWPLPVVPS